MKLVIVHLKLKNYSEEVIYVVWIRVDNYIPDPFLLYLSQNRSRNINRNKYVLSTQVCSYIFEIYIIYLADNNKVLPVVFRVCLSNIKFQILHWRCPYQILQSNQTKLVFIKNGSSGPIQKLHHVLKWLIKNLKYIPKRKRLSRHGLSMNIQEIRFYYLFWITL